jgi:hypothetical protein
MPKKKRAKKKYISSAAQQQQQERQYKKLFYLKVRNLCRQIGDVSLFDKMPPDEKETIYLFRSAPLKVMAAPGAKIQKRMMDALTKTIKSQQLIMTLQVISGSDEVMTFADYALAGMPLEYLASDTIANHPGKELLDKYAELREQRELAYENGILKICSLACWLFDNWEKHYIHTYNFKTYTPAIDNDYHPPLVTPATNPATFIREWHTLQQQDYRTHQTVTINTHPLEIRKITINGETHSAIQTGMISYPDDQPVFIPYTLSLESLHVNTPFAKLELPVYIQQHALNRMRERIGNTTPCFYYNILTGAILRKEAVFLTKNRLLLACYTGEMKLGYFLTEMVEGILLIRTFLLLTNSGTPEGDKLAQLTGLETSDRQYLSIDTLQGLAHSDITQNETVSQLFHKAGCASILQLCEKINTDPGMMWLLDKSQPKNIVADLLAEYLKADE